jgi:hypothetical protein
MDDCWKALLAKREELAKDSQALWLVAFDWIAAASADSCGWSKVEHHWKAAGSVRQYVVPRRT